MGHFERKLGLFLCLIFSVFVPWWLWVEHLEASDDLLSSLRLAVFMGVCATTSAGVSFFWIETYFEAMATPIRVLRVWLFVPLIAAFILSAIAGIYLWAIGWGGSPLWWYVWKFALPEYAATLTACITFKNFVGDFKSSTA